MRMPVFALVWVFCMTGVATAQHHDDTSVPRVIGNRANGFSYQPTPNEVAPREAAAGVRPSKAQQDASDQTLETIDRNLLREEGLSEKDVPSFRSHQ